MSSLTFCLSRESIIVTSFKKHFSYFVVSGIIGPSNHREQLGAGNEGIPFVRGTDETNEATDLADFFDMNKGTLLPSIRRLIGTMDQQNDASNGLDRNGHENVVHVFINSYAPGNYRILNYSFIKRFHKYADALL